MDLETKLTDAEHKKMIGLLYRFSVHELDQFENAKFDTPLGPIFISISRSANGCDDAFRDITQVVKELEKLD